MRRSTVLNAKKLPEPRQVRLAERRKLLGILGTRNEGKHKHYNALAEVMPFDAIVAPILDTGKIL